VDFPAPGVPTKRKTSKGFVLTTDKTRETSLEVAPANVEGENVLRNSRGDSPRKYSSGVLNSRPTFSAKLLIHN
jgi:hypothetical protein